VTRAPRPWWRSAVVYQVYIRSFADADGDGVGDVAGLRRRLPYLAELGVDAIWINPWYPSPLRDGGYDVADYRAIDPSLGTLPEAQAMLNEAHASGLRVLLDLVPNHVSDQHAWFRRALEAPPGSPARARFIFRPGCGPTGAEPPNNWTSNFGGSAWTRVADADGRPGEWYLHLFAPEQSDLDWTNSEVRDEFAAIMRFWFDLGIDGFRIDVAHGLAKAEGLPDASTVGWPPPAGEPVEHPHWDRDEVHEIYRAWRALADEYEDPRVFVAEAWVQSPERLARYVRSDELHTAFNFDFLLAPWQAQSIRRSIETTLRTHSAVGASPTWVLSNHDTIREVSRYARRQGVRPLRTLGDLVDLPPDFALGLRRARAAVLLMLALPGGAYVYQGAELGLPEVEDLPVDVLRDPGWELSDHTERGRDGCRVPIPWSGSAPPFGFSPPGASAPPWLPQPAAWSDLTVERQAADPGSTLGLYRRALALRREHPALGGADGDGEGEGDGEGDGGGGEADAAGDGEGEFSWLPAPAGALAFAREPGFACIVNLSADGVTLPSDATLLIASGPLTDDAQVPHDTAVWVTTGPREETPI